MQIKRLQAERNDLHKQLMAARKDISKLEGKLQVSISVALLCGT